MAVESIDIKTFVSASLLAIYRLGRLVSSSGSSVQYNGVGQVPLGSIRNDVSAANKDVDIAFLHPGRTYVVIASGVVAAGATLYAAADGKVSATAVGPPIMTALEAATADGDEIEAVAIEQNYVTYTEQLPLFDARVSLVSRSCQLDWFSGFPTIVSKSKQISLFDGKLATGLQLGSAAAANVFGIIAGTFGAASPVLQGEDAKATSKSDVTRFMIPVPDDYVAGTDLTLTVYAGMDTTVSDTSATIDVIAHESDGNQAISADLCATAAQSCNSLTKAALAFTITGTALVQGDILDVEIIGAATDAATGTAVIIEVGKITLGWTARVDNGLGVSGVAAGGEFAVVPGTFGAASPLLRTADAKATTLSSTRRFLVTVPPDHVSGTDLTLAVLAGMNTTVSDTTATVDVEAFESDGDGGVSADLCASAAQSCNSLTKAAKAFTITGTSLAAGDVLDVRVTLAITDGATATVVKGEIGKITLGWTARVDNELGATEVAASGNFAIIPGTFGAASPVLQTADAKASTVTTRKRFTYQIPADYVKGTNLTLVAYAGMDTTVSDTTATIDFEVYLSDGDAGVGSDLCATAAQSINSLTKASKSFTITGTSLSPGDLLDIRATLAITDGATATVVKGEMGKLSMARYRSAA